MSIEASDVVTSETQEPVAWISAKQLSGMHIDPRFNLVQWETTLTVSKTHDGQIPLYAHPQPKAEQVWISLTNEDVVAAWHEWRQKSNDIELFAEIIESKLKEKNHEQ